MNMIRPHRTSCAAFTLVELLVTMAIIAILASIAITGLYVAQESAREARTAALISKIDSVVRPRWEAYRSRPLPADLQDLPGLSGNANPTLQQIAAARVQATRTLMRLELPERWEDLFAVTGSSPDMVISNSTVRTPAWLPVTGAMQSYRAYVDTIFNTRSAYPSVRFGGPECLYMIAVSDGAGDFSSRSLFSEHEIGDKDNDGAYEFRDAWGNPIFFFRWASGFTPYSELQRPDAPDPFDPRGTQAGAYALYPLIVSPGPDGLPGLWARSDGFFYGSSDANDNPFYKEDSSPLPGTPDGNSHFDNIHNHRSLDSQ